MSISTLPQIETSIQGLSFQEKLGLLEWLVKTIRTDTVLEQGAEEAEVTEPAAAHNIQNLANENGVAPKVIGEQLNEYEDDDTALLELVARIKATPPNPEMIIHPTKTFQEVADRWAATSPTDEDIPPDEWDRLWADFEAELKAADRANDIAEGRL